MKEANLVSILGAFRTLHKPSFQSYVNYHSIKIKDGELEVLQHLVANIQLISTEPALYDKYFIGYSIPQISKEFDLLRIDDETIVNIELKENSTEEKIVNQLLRNKYYLGFLNRDTFCYAYIMKGNKLYTLDNTNSLKQIEFKQLTSVLASQNVKPIRDINSYFNPSNYLVSPFNSTEAFVRGKYFLTSQQEEIKSKVLGQLRLPSLSIISIKGNAGTGKTLLTYDIGKEVSNKEAILIIHCGNLNPGQIKLRDKYGWNIVPVKGIKSVDLTKYHLIIIDEAQRIYPRQLEHVIEDVKKSANNLIFSYDSKQTLRKRETINNIPEKIEKETTIPPFELTNKIRTNKEIAAFIHCLFNNRRGLEKYTYNNIELNYFSNYEDAKSFLHHLWSEDWKVINYTPSSYDKLPYDKHNLVFEPDNAHKVIGQEFDNIVAVIDEHFYYNANGDLDYKINPYYDPTKMLFQIVSRTRLKLKVVIINNQNVLSRCLEILNQK